MLLPVRGMPTANSSTQAAMDAILDEAYLHAWSYVGTATPSTNSHAPNATAKWRTAL